MHYTIWFVRKVDRGLEEDKLAKETNTFLVGRLNDFVRRGREIEGKGFEGFGERTTYHWEVEHFLKLHFSNDYYERFRERNTYALEEIIKELLDKAKSGKAAVKTLRIVFEPHSEPNKTPFYETYEGANGEPWTLFRIGVISSVPAIVWVKVRDVILDKERRYNVHLHRMHAEHRVVRVEVSPDILEYWDVVQKSASMDNAILTHIEPLPGNLPTGEQRFEIVASSRDGLVNTRTGVVSVEDKALQFRLTAPENREPD